MATAQTFRPVKRVFVLRQFIVRSAILLVIAFAVVLAILDEGGPTWLTLLPLILWAASLVFNLFDLTAGYAKTSYEIHDDRIIYNTGGLFSDKTTNLPFRNVTQIEMWLPFLENRFHSTGHLAVHSAGSNFHSGSLISVEEPEAIFALLEARLRENGFSINRSEMIQQEKPGLVGALLDGATFWTAGSTFLILIAGFFLGVAALFESMAVFLGALVVILPFCGSALAAQVRFFIDRKQRTYTLWDDCIEYHQGVLTRRAKLIPFANLADTYVKEPFWKRSFGMADVVISCQGTSGNIRFPSMPRAAQFQDNLKRLLHSTPTIPSVAEPPDTTATGAAPSGIDGKSTFLPPRLGVTSGSSKTFHTNIFSYLAGSLLTLSLLLISLIVFVPGAVLLGVEFALPGIGLILFLTSIPITLVIAYSLYLRFTINYVFGPNSVSWSRDLLSRKDTFEFANDKVTAITVRRTFIDRLLNTVSITFHSIGSTEPLHFKCLSDYEGVLAELHQRFGLPDGEPLEEIATDVRPGAVVASQSINFLVLGLLASPLALFGIAMGLLPQNAIPAALITCAIISALLMARSRFYHSRSRLRLFEHHIMVRKGIFDHKYTYMAYHNARNVVSTLYPGQVTGSLVIDGGGTAILVSIEHLYAPYELHDRLDAVLYQRPMRDVAQSDTFNDDVLEYWRPESKNAHISSLISLVVLVTIPLLPLMWLYNRAYYKSADFSLQTDRVVRRGGGFFKEKNSVLFNRIDQLQIRRDMIHNYCKNGVVEVYTVGSSEVELTLGPHRDFQEIYHAIDARAGHGGV